jgi:hypothetical protein
MIPFIIVSLQRLSAAKGGRFAVKAKLPALFIDGSPMDLTRQNWQAQRQGNSPSYGIAFALCPVISAAFGSPVGLVILSQLCISSTTLNRCKKDLKSSELYGHPPERD